MNRLAKTLDAGDWNGTQKGDALVVSPKAKLDAIKASTEKRASKKAAKMLEKKWKLREIEQELQEISRRVNMLPDRSRHGWSDSARGSS